MNFNKLFALAQSFEEQAKYNPDDPSLNSQENVMQSIGDIEECLETIEMTPWLNHGAVVALSELKRWVSKLHSEVGKSAI